MSKSRNITSARALRRAIAEADRRGITQAAIAKATGIQRSTMSRIVSGDAMPQLDTAERILKAAGYKLVVARIVAKKRHVA